MKTILITGGAGFIGCNLCEKLLNDNHKIICVDNLLTGNIKNIEHLINKPNFEFINHDIIYPLEINDDIHEIYNLACPASPPKYQKDPINTLKVNFLGVLNLLELAKFKKAKFLQSSTSEVYGEPEITPQHENYRGNVNTVGIRSCYDEGKRVAETLVMEYHNQYNIDTRIVRIFNTYGPKMDKNDGRVVTNFINQALNDKDITLYGDGDQTRSFCYIYDQIDGLIKLMNSDYIYPINIGNPHEITVKDLASIILTLTKSDSKIVYKNLPLDDPTNRKPDITRAINILGWHPNYNLEEGLIKTIEYFR
jgi:UDP-glucuronate decarboxylase